MDVIEAIKTRRSVRHYQATPVDEETLKLVLEAARWAPSWANTQCWRFVVVRDPNIKSQLADILRPTNPAMDAIRNAPVVIVACTEMEKSGYMEGEPYPHNKLDWCLFDLGLAVENLLLAAHSFGLGTVPVGSFDAKRAAEILGIPAGFRAVLMTPLGYREREPRPRPRKELSEIVFYERWT